MTNIFGLAVVLMYYYIIPTFHANDFSLESIFLSLLFVIEMNIRHPFLSFWCSNEAILFVHLFHLDINSVTRTSHPSRFDLDKGILPTISWAVLHSLVYYKAHFSSLFVFDYFSAPLRFFGAYDHWNIKCNFS